MEWTSDDNDQLFDLQYEKMTNDSVGSPLFPHQTIGKGSGKQLEIQIHEGSAPILYLKIP